MVWNNHHELKKAFYDEEFGYKQSNSDHTLFIKHKEGKVTTLIVYVDDMVLTGDDQEERKALQQFLASKFKMKRVFTEVS